MKNQRGMSKSLMGLSLSISIVVFVTVLIFAGGVKPAYSDDKKAEREKARAIRAENHRGQPPGPKVSFCNSLWGCYFEMEKEGTLSFFDNMVEEYGADGTPVQVSFGVFKNLYIVSDPEDIHQILSGPLRDSFIKGFGAKTLSYYFLGSGLAVLETNELWLKLHSLMQPYFTARGVSSYFKSFQENSGEWVKQLALTRDQSQGLPIDIEKEVTLFTIRGILKTMFQMDLPYDERGTQKTEELRNSVGTILDFAQYRMRAPLSAPLFIPTPGNRKYKKALVEVKKIVSEIVENAKVQGSKQENNPSNTLIQALLKAQNGDRPSPESDSFFLTGDQLQDQVLGIFFAGHDTTSHFLTMAIYRAFQNPQILKKLKEELIEKLGPKMELTHESQISQLVYLQSFMKEVLRTDSSIPGVARDAIEDVNLRGYQIKQGSTIYLSFNSVHRAPEFWKNPDLFDPERFMPSKTGNSSQSEERHIRSFTPFSGGQRVCLGQFFALQETKIALIQVLASGLDFKLAEGANVKPIFSCTVKLENGLPMTIQ